MTMPDVIWVDETSEDEDGFILGRFDQKYCNVDQCYIHKDIADELARLVEMAMRGKFLSEDGAEALARYHTATEGK